MGTWTTFLYKCRITIIYRMRTGSCVPANTLSCLLRMYRKLLVPMTMA